MEEGLIAGNSSEYGVVEVEEVASGTSPIEVALIMARGTEDSPKRRDSVSAGSASEGRLLRAPPHIAGTLRIDGSKRRDSARARCDSVSVACVDG